MYLEFVEDILLFGEIFFVFWDGVEGGIYMGDEKKMLDIKLKLVVLGWGG